MALQQGAYCNLPTFFPGQIHNLTEQALCLKGAGTGNTLQGTRDGLLGSFMLKWKISLNCLKPGLKISWEIWSKKDEKKDASTRLLIMPENQ